MKVRERRHYPKSLANRSPAATVASMVVYRYLQTTELETRTEWFSILLLWGVHRRDWAKAGAIRLSLLYFIY